MITTASARPNFTTATEFRTFPRSVWENMHEAWPATFGDCAQHAIMQSADGLFWTFSQFTEVVNGDIIDRATYEQRWSAAMTRAIQAGCDPDSLPPHIPANES